MKRFWAGLGMLLVVMGPCLSASPARRRAPAKVRRPVVKRLVRLSVKAHKPSAPVTITVMPGAVVGDGRQQIRAWVRPHVDAERIDVEVETRDGLGVAQGRSKWSIPARADAAVSEDLVLAITGAGERGLMVVATLVFNDGSTLTGYEAAVLNPGGRANPVPRPAAEEITMPDGSRVLAVPVPDAP